MNKIYLKNKHNKGKSFKMLDELIFHYRVTWANLLARTCVCLQGSTKIIKAGIQKTETGIRNPESRIQNPESKTTIRREKYLMVKYMTWGKKYGIKKLKSLVGIKESAVYKRSNVLYMGQRETTYK